ncbi:MAG: hypothetical protein AB7P03_10685 [Kofleriaceae bacterium]
MIRVDPKVSDLQPQPPIEAVDTEQEQPTDGPEPVVFSGTGAGRSASERAYDSEPTFSTSSRTPDTELSAEQKRALVADLADDVVMDHIDRLWPTLLEIHDHNDQLRQLETGLDRLDTLDHQQRGEVIQTSSHHIRSIVELADQAGIATPQLLRSASRALYELDSHGHRSSAPTHESEGKTSDAFVSLVGRDIRVATFEVGERSKPSSPDHGRSVLIDLRGFRG